MSLALLPLILALTLPQTPVKANATPAPKPARAAAKAPNATPLKFKEFFEPTPAELKPTAKLQSLDGRRVKIIGFMAQMEEPLKGGFFLCPRPTACDEGGGGTGDLPPESVFVVVRSAVGKELAHKPQALEVTGILQIGAQTDADGHVSMLRIVLDRPQPRPASQSPRPHSKPSLNGKKSLHSTPKRRTS